jgi:transcription elongation factor Elf1
MTTKIIKMDCGFCGKRVGDSITLIQGKEFNICKVCNQKWQLKTLAVSA